MRYFPLLLLLITPCTLFAQENYHIKLDTVIVTGKKTDNKGGVGVRKSEINQVELQRNATRSLSELLLEGSALQIKSMGQGAQATVSFRGTSSNHTQVLWNGISVNSPQLGSFDFSQVPVYFIDQVSLTHGSSTPYASAGAIGGTINFSNENKPVSAFQLNVISEYASNQTFTEAFTAKFTKGKLTSATRVFYQQSENNYKYINKVYSNIPTIERRKEADYKQGGVMQELTWRFSPKNKLSWLGWVQMDDRSLPQSVIVNVTASEQSKSSNYRTLLNFDHIGSVGSLNASLAYLRGKMDYTRDFSEMTTDHYENIYNSIVATMEYKYRKWEKLIPSLVLHYRFDDVNSDNFIDSYASRNSYTAKLLLTWYPVERLQLDANGSLQGVDSRCFGTYGVSAAYELIPQLLQAKVSQSYNHRTPTLNDLYWNPGGNPDLKDETSVGGDVSLSTDIRINPRMNLKAEASYYYMSVDNWIMWIPKGNGYVWEPVNFSKVTSQGAEFNASFDMTTGRFDHTLSGVYAYAHSVDNSSRGDGAEGKQIPYVPRNRWNLAYRVEYLKKLWFHYNVSYTGVRFTAADESYQTNDYTIHNFEVGYRLNIDKYRIGLSCKMENAFNAYYESTQYYPMPLRMFWGRLTFSF